MEGRQKRHVGGGSLRPEPAAFIVDEVGRASAIAALPQPALDVRAVLAIALRQLFELHRRRAGIEELSADYRLGTCRNGGGMAAAGDLSLQRPQHLLGAAATFVTDRGQGVGDVQDASAAA